MITLADTEHSSSCGCSYPQTKREGVVHEHVAHLQEVATIEPQTTVKDRGWVAILHNSEVGSSNCLVLSIVDPILVLSVELKTEYIINSSLTSASRWCEAGWALWKTDRAFWLHEEPISTLGTLKERVAEAYKTVAVAVRTHVKLWNVEVRRVTDTVRCVLSVTDTLATGVITVKSFTNRTFVIVAQVTVDSSCTTLVTLSLTWEADSSFWIWIFVEVTVAKAGW